MTLKASPLQALARARERRSLQYFFASSSGVARNNSCDTCCQAAVSHPPSTSYITTDRTPAAQTELVRHWGLRTLYWTFPVFSISQHCVRGRVNVMKFEGTGIVEGTENTPNTGKAVGIVGVSTQ